MRATAKRTYYISSHLSHRTSLASGTTEVQRRRDCVFHRTERCFRTASALCECLCRQLFLEIRANKKEREMGQCTSKSSARRAVMGLQAATTPQETLDNLSTLAATIAKTSHKVNDNVVVLIPEATEDATTEDDETVHPVPTTVATTTTGSTTAAANNVATRRLLLWRFRQQHHQRAAAAAPNSNTRISNHKNAAAAPPLLSSLVSSSFNVLPDIEEINDDSEHQSGGSLVAPSDEEESSGRSIRRVVRSDETTIQRRRRQQQLQRGAHTITTRLTNAPKSGVLLGPLSPVKIKTALCVQPSSIRIRPPPTLNTTTTMEAPAAPLHNNESTAEDDADDVSMLHYFGKLKLQVQVAEQQSQKRKVVAKLDDRVVDVTHHRNVWQQYQQIQQCVQVVVEHAPLGGVRESNLAEQDSQSPPSPNENATQAATAAAAAPSKQKANQRRGVGVAKKGSRNDKTPKKSSESMSTTSRLSRRQRGKKSDSNASSSLQQQQQRTDSFQLLHQTQSWFFDFDDEFQLAESAALPPLQPPNNKNSDNLSLLSEASMAVQRRLYAKKQRQRQLKKAAAATMTMTTPAESSTPRNESMLRDDTPVARNGMAHHGEDDDMAIMEVAFCSPATTAAAAGAPTTATASYAEPDNYSLVSDLDDSQSFSSLASNRYDYGVPRRHRRAAAAASRQLDEIGGGADHSSLVSDDDYSVGNSRNSAAAAEPVVFDFQSVLQRRLDIEARLRALIAMDDDQHSNQAASDQVVVSSDEAVDHDDDSGREELGAFPKSAEMARTTTVVQASRTADGPMEGSGKAFALSAIVSPLNRGTSASLSVCAQRSSDSERHLCSVTSDAFPVSPDTRHGEKMNPAVVVTPSVGREHFFHTKPTANSRRGGGTYIAQTAPQTNPTRVVSPENVANNESFESTESPGFMTVPYLGVKQSLGRPKSFDETDSLRASPSLNGTDCSESNSRRNLHDSFLESGLDEISMVANQSMSSEYEVPIHEESLECSLVHDDARGGTRKTCVMEDAHDTLLLADQVEARVKDILHRYRNENSENRSGLTN
jgi:hypothetical protein